MEIRILTDMDAAEFWELRFRALREDTEAFAATYEEEIKKHIESLINSFRELYIVPVDQNFVLGAFDSNNHMVGVVGFGRGIREKLRHKANVWGMYVVPELRQNGLGRLLLTSLINKAKALDGLEQLNLGVVSGNFQAKGLYSSMGFTTYGTEKNALKTVGRYSDEELMVLFICRYN